MKNWTINFLTKHFMAGITLILFFGFGLGLLFLHFWAPINYCDLCDNSSRIDMTTAKPDACVTLNQQDAQSAFDHYIEAVENTGTFGAWIGKELIDQSLAGNNMNGFFIILGKDATGQTCFMLKADKTDYRTTATGGPDVFFKLDAMCPKLCDGLDPH